MVPILWRYTAASYLKTFLLTVSTFILVLLVSRFKEIARFSSICSDPTKLGLFTVYQIPFILPMAIPLSGLIAAFLLFQQMSQTQELTALRGTGLHLKKILTPILFASLFLALMTFSICSGIAPFCKRETKTFLFQETVSIPLSTMENNQFLGERDIYLKTKNKFALITYNENNERLSLITAGKIAIDDHLLLGSNVSIVSHLKGADDQFDPLIIETQNSMSMDASNLEPLFKKNRPKLDASMLSFRMLLANPSHAAISEMFRRISFSLSVFSLTLLGAVFSIEQNRTPSKKNLIYLILLTLSTLASYLLGKGLKYEPSLTAVVYFAPHLLIWMSCLIQIRRLEKGVT